MLFGFKQCFSVSLLKLIFSLQKIVCNKLTRTDFSKKNGLSKRKNGLSGTEFSERTFPNGIFRTEKFPKKVYCQSGLYTYRLF